MKKTPKDVDAYIAGAPKEVQDKLKELRKAIRIAVPKAKEKISYEMPFYGYRGRLMYFAYAKHHISLYVMPPIVKDHAKELKKYKTATATICFPLNEKLPITLIKKLVRAGVQNNDAKAEKKKEKNKKSTVSQITPRAPKEKFNMCSRRHKYYGNDICPICWQEKLKKEHIVYHKDGSIWAKGKIVAGVPDGYWEWFRKEGSKMRSGYFAKGKQVGVWTTYDRAGKPFRATEMKGEK
jgi:uncharacterized protein YdhG (YjbR/CyaY superfamily)